jgi:hypothetical protein
MRASRFSQEQIIEILRGREAGAKRRIHAGGARISEATSTPMDGPRYGKKNRVLNDAHDRCSPQGGGNIGTVYPCGLVISRFHLRRGEFNSPEILGNPPRG